MLRDAALRAAPQHEGEQRHVGQTKSRGGTNLRLWETIAGSGSLFPACYLQWMAQLQRVERQPRARRASWVPNDASCDVMEQGLRNPSGVNLTMARLSQRGDNA
jgi:hypothetical protein